jgi:hypothetical protein
MSQIPFNPLYIGDAESLLTTVNLADLTTGELDGTGAFDILMNSVSLHIQAEFDKGRITGKDYATVYLGAMQGVLQASVAFMTSGKEVEKFNAEIGLLRQKTVSELVNTCNTIPAGLGFNNSTAIQGTALKQNNLYEAQTNGFARDAEQKVLKVLVDTWSVRRTTDDGTIASPSNGLDDASILAIVNKAKSGIGI